MWAGRAAVNPGFGLTFQWTQHKGTCYEDEPV